MLGDQNKFDKCLQCERIKIKNTFRVLRNQWTIQRALNCNVKHVQIIIVACCVLHNLCIYNIDSRFVNMAPDNTDDMLNDNDVQPTTHTRYL
jgi:hypothetical protein